MKKIELMLIALLMALSANAQRAITGRVVDGDSKETVPMATVKLLKTDSTMVSGILSDDEGNFKIVAPANGQFILQITSVGYKDYTHSLNIKDGKDQPVGTIKIGRAHV